MIIKVCGMRDAENIRELEALGADWMGMIFWPHSSRYVAQCPSYLPGSLKKVGVFVDADEDYIRRYAKACQLDIIQLHGHEPPALAMALRPLTVIKAFSIASVEDLQQTKPYEGVADYFLFDTKGKSAGGNGQKFDWSLLHHYHGQTPFLLSGGIGPEDAESLRAFHHPMWAGIDLNSRFETEPGLKDITKLREFTKQLRS